MNKYIQILLGVLSIGGGFIAITSILNFIVSSAGVAGYIFWRYRYSGVSVWNLVWN